MDICEDVMKDVAKDLQADSVLEAEIALQINQFYLQAYDRMKSA